MSTQQNSSAESKQKRVIKLSALFFILIVLPLGTALFTRGGGEYFKEMISELHDYRELPDFQFQAHNGQVISKDKLKGKLAVIAFFSLDDPKAALIAGQVQKLHQSFDNDNEVLFLMHTLNPEEDSMEELKVFAESNGLRDEEQCYVLSSSQQAVYNYLAEGFKWPTNYADRDLTTPLQFEDVPANLKSYPYFVITNTGGMIKNYYNYEDNKVMARLIEHLALMLPSRTDDDPELVREKEK
jgi:peroxiredoxin